MFSSSATNNTIQEGGYILLSLCSTLGDSYALHKMGNQLPMKVENACEQGMPIYNKEMLAIIHAPEKWKQYLIGSKFEVKTNHKSPKYLFN